MVLKENELTMSQQYNSMPKVGNSTHHKVLPAGQGRSLEILPPCLALEATYEALCLLMGSSVQERQGFA